MESTSPPNLLEFRGFASTHWTVVRACAESGTVAGAAREELCRTYWYPVYAHLRRSGQQSPDCEDLTQDFFEHILTRPWFSQSDQSRGKFRSFLLASLNNFVRDRLSRRRTLKRGGGVQMIPFDLRQAGERYAQSEVPSISPDQIYEVEWASTIVEATLRRLEHEYASAGKADQYRCLKIFLTTEGTGETYAAAAQCLGTSSVNVKVCVSRLRKSYAATMQTEVAKTVATSEDIPCEMRHMREMLALGCV